MKNELNCQLSILVTLLAICFLLTECKKDEMSLAPAAITGQATWIYQTGATLNGSVNANNLETTAIFEYGTTDSYGQTIIATPGTLSGNTNTDVVASLTGLTVSLTYHYRVKAVNSKGTSYGNDLTFTTSGGANIFNANLNYGSVSDNDGNTYKTIQIATQTWMAENLKTTKLNDGTAIPLVTDGTAWALLSTPGYCWYDNNDPVYKASYGAIYNWYAVNTGKLCPTGWHVPSDPEWTTLTNNVGGETIAGDKLKETGVTHWLTPNTEATNQSGFTALPGGYRDNYGSYYHNGDYGYWWSVTEYSASKAYYRFIISSGIVTVYYYKEYGLSVRCLKNN
jgi:uncharacterized protein (TIGR02145 family)